MRIREYTKEQLKMAVRFNDLEKLEIESYEKLAELVSMYWHRDLEGVGEQLKVTVQRFENGRPYKLYKVRTNLADAPIETYKYIDGVKTCIKTDMFNRSYIEAFGYDEEDAKKCAKYRMKDWMSKKEANSFRVTEVEYVGEYLENEYAYREYRPKTREEVKTARVRAKKFR